MGSFVAMGVATADELVRVGREALAAAEWERARSFFEQAAEFGESAEICPPGARVEVLVVARELPARIEERDLEAGEPN